MARKRQGGRDVDGIVLLDKPTGITSNRALQRVKRLFDAAKAGHTGSLDPLATGMLPICLGQATKVSGFLLEASKSYRVVARLGIATDTGDADGEVVERSDAQAPAAADLSCTLDRFVGELEQVPPMYSALKHRGQPLYKLARRGVDVERRARRVRVHTLTVEDYAWPKLELGVRCSKGTYIRTLVSDLAVALGTVGHVAALRRTSVDPFEEAGMTTLAELEADAERGIETLDRRLLPSDTALSEWPAIALDAGGARKLAQGRQLPREPGWPEGAVRVYGPERRFLGVADVTSEGSLIPRRLFVG